MSQSISLFCVALAVRVPEAKQPFWEQWLVSPGAAAAGAFFVLLGAIIAAAVSKSNAKIDRRAKETQLLREQWWARAEWGFEKALSHDDATKRFGYEFLDGLARSKVAAGHDIELVRAAELIKTTADRDLDRYQLTWVKGQLIITPKKIFGDDGF